MPIARSVAAPLLLESESTNRDSARHLANRVVEAIEREGVLTFATRQRLLDLGARLGIGRFEANLVIALVQHRRQSIPSHQPRPFGRPATVISPAKGPASQRSRWQVPLAFTALFCGELIIAATLWLAVLR